MKTLALTFSGQNQEPISLATKLQKIIMEDTSENSINIHLIIKKNSTIIIKDDLISVGIHACNITATLHKNSTLFLEARFLCPSLIKKTECGCCHLAIDNHHNVVRNLSFDLREPGARVNSCIRFAGGKNRTFNLNVIHNHNAEGTHSIISTKNVLDENSQLTCSLLTTAKAEAKNSTTNQVNKNLVLDRNVKINTSPNLKIETNVVKCSHSSATSPLEKEILFYLQSRGLSQEQAKESLISAYLV